MKLNFLIGKYSIMLWHTLRHVLDKGQEMTLPPHQSEKSLANKFASFFHKKIKRIRDMFTASSTVVIPTMCTPPNLPHFNEVSENEVLKNHQKFPYKIMSFRSSAYFPFERLCGNFTSVNYKTCQSVIS